MRSDYIGWLYMLAAHFKIDKNNKSEAALNLHTMRTKVSDEYLPATAAVTTTICTTPQKQYVKA